MAHTVCETKGLLLNPWLIVSDGLRVTGLPLLLFVSQKLSLVSGLPTVSSNEYVVSYVCVNSLAPKPFFISHQGETINKVLVDTPCFRAYPVLLLLCHPSYPRFTVVGVCGIFGVFGQPCF